MVGGVEGGASRLALLFERQTVFFSILSISKARSHFLLFFSEGFLLVCVFSLIFIKSIINLFYFLKTIKCPSMEKKKYFFPFSFEEQLTTNLVIG